ncbi:alanine dehydrogenase [Rhizobium sp. BK529]|uniref:ornithine cyclodeaminase n=1 Tax=Rhizobium sp. BK529 TaxID=2586983 RepID=UPI00162218A0|nr:ornithine cyclodeaminase [Rhizobium sp. BK529]MBB3594809.1 alanine dehydrogenase [Rhizobium sp. BK529]
MKASDDILLLDAKDLEQGDRALTIGEIHLATTNAWDEIRSGTARGGKAVFSLSEEEFWSRPDFAPFKGDFADERLGWKLSSLYGINSTYGGVKVIGANAFNRRLGLPRSTSTFILFDKYTLRPIAILDETALSAERTGTYASIVAERCLRRRATVSVFLLGSGPVARSVIRSLTYSCQTRVEQIFIRSRRIENARALAIALSGETTIPLRCVEDNNAMRDCALVVTATNARGPVFGDEELAEDATTLHLGGDEAPADYLRRALRSGLVICDDLQTVSRRNSQSIALHFSRQGLSLEAVGPLIGIRSLCQMGDWSVDAEGPTCITCVGLPVLDLFVAQASYEKYCRAVGLDRNDACTV